MANMAYKVGGTWSQRVLLVACVLALGACASKGEDLSAVFSADNTLQSTLRPVQGQVGNAATVRLLPYVDQRNAVSPRWLGVNTTRIMGMTGKELVLDQDVASVVDVAMANQFRKAGFQVLEGEAARDAKFEIAGAVRQLTLNAKARDEIDVVIETRVTDLATGKLIWSAAVAEKGERFAGVAGNNKNDIVAYLNSALATTSRKTADAVNGLLMAGYPALFNLTPGTKTIAGVTVYSAPIAVPAPATAVATASQPVVQAGRGILSLSSQPSRAKIYLDGIYYGLTPMKVEVDEGVHTLEIKLAGRTSVSEKVSIRRGETTEWEAALGH